MSLEPEAVRAAAAKAGLYGQYASMIQAKIKQHFDPPESARPGLDCTISVVQLPSGEVVSAEVTSCNGDDAVRRSIERAVMDASPLPKPPIPEMFERNLSITLRVDN